MRLHNQAKLYFTVTALWLLLFALPASALEPAWLDDMPSVDQVLTDTQGKNALDTKARQAGAFAHLATAIEVLADRRRVTGFLPDERRLIDLYRGRYFQLQEEAKAITGPPDGTPDSAWARWLAQQGRYERDEALRVEVLTRYLSADSRVRLNFASADLGARVRESKREMMRGLGQEVSFWDEMEPQQQGEFLAVMLLVLVLFGLMMIREVRRFGLLRSDPFTLQAGFGRLALRDASGIVENYGKWTDTTKTTTVTRHENGQTSTSTSYNSVTHEVFTLRGPDVEHSVHVLNANLNVQNGSLVTAVWGVRKRKDSGDYLIFFDRSTQRRLPMISALQAVLAPTRWLMLPALLASTVLSASTPLWLGLLPRTNGLLRGFLGLFAGWVLMLLILGLIARFRAKRFARTDGPRLLAAIEGRESGEPKA